MKVVIDTDPGIDDALAILLALSTPDFEVLGVTTVAGNLGLDVTTRNALRVLALAGREDIPVITGAGAPLKRSGRAPEGIHGEDGLGNVQLPDPMGAAADGAVDWMAGLLGGEPASSVDVLALGPLTNLALLLEQHPAAAARIRRVIAMGGAVREPGNCGPRSEFNLAADPEAAVTVLESSLDLTLVPLDVTRRVRATGLEVARLEASRRAEARAAAALIAAYFQRTTGGESRPLHDPCVMLLAAAPHLFGTESLPLRVETDSAADAGALAEGPHRIKVATRVDGAAALELLVQSLSGA